MAKGKATERWVLESWEVGRGDVREECGLTAGYVAEEEEGDCAGIGHREWIL